MASNHTWTSVVTPTIPPWGQQSRWTLGNRCLSLNITGNKRQGFYTNSMIFPYILVSLKWDIIFAKTTVKLLVQVPFFTYIERIFLDTKSVYSISLLCNCIMHCSIIMCVKDRVFWTYFQQAVQHCVDVYANYMLKWYFIAILKVDFITPTQ